MRPEYKGRERPQHVATASIWIMWIDLLHCCPHENVEICLNRVPFLANEKGIHTPSLGDWDTKALLP